MQMVWVVKADVTRNEMIEDWKALLQCGYGSGWKVLIKWAGKTQTEAEFMAYPMKLKEMHWLVCVLDVCFGCHLLGTCLCWCLQVSACHIECEQGVLG